MLKKTITYTDYNEVERKEDFYFNLTEAEVLEMEMGTVGGLAEQIQKIVDAKNQQEIIKIFKDLILKAYGEKSEDGRRFIKSDDISIGFSQTEAFSILYMELATDDKAGADFVNGIMPKKLVEKAAAMSAKNNALPASNN